MASDQWNMRAKLIIVFSEQALLKISELIE